MRITFGSAFRDGLADINTAAELMTQAQRQLSSGKRVNAPSDDPTAAASAVTDSATIASIDAYTQSSDAAWARLTAADSAMTDVVSQLTSAQTTLASAMGTSATQSQRDAASKQLLAIRDALLADFNTQFRGTSVFGGAKSTTTPYVIDAAGVATYQGDGTSMQMAIDDNLTVPVTFDGSAIAQGADPQDILTALSGLATAAASGDQTAMTQGMAALSRAFDRATTAQSQLGIGEQLITNGGAKLSAAKLAAQTRLSKEQDADMATAASNLSQAQTSYQASLGAFATLGRTSLMDYLT